MPRFGVLGTITHDLITSESGRRREGLGGVLYQAAVLCGMGMDVSLHTTLGSGLFPEVLKTVRGWKTFDGSGIVRVPGPGNRVRLDYPQKRERVEVLESVGPPLDPGSVLRRLPGMDMLILVINSGYDIRLEDWRKIVEIAGCPVWLDIHSLVLEPVLQKPRRYRPLPEWEDWAGGVTYLQANRQEIACMLGNPWKKIAAADIRNFADAAFRAGVAVVFVTAGRDGVFFRTRNGGKHFRPAGAPEVIDPTGCGDVFCAATAAGLARGSSLSEAVTFGVDLATRAVRASGISETFLLARQAGQESRRSG